MNEETKSQMEPVEAGSDLEREVRRGIWHLECCSFRESGKECDCGCMDAMDALNRLVAERDQYRKAFDEQSRELEIALEFLTPETFAEFRRRAYPTLHFEA